MWNTNSLAFFAAVAIGSTTQALASTNALDATFGTGGIVLLGPTPVSNLKLGIATVLALSNGKMLVAGRSSNDSDPGLGAILPAVGRLNADGSWDTSFADNGLFILPFGSTAAPNGGFVNHLALISDGSIVASGGTYATWPSYELETCSLLMKLSSGGVPDTGFAEDHSGSFCFDFAPNTSGYHPYGHFEGLQVDSDDTIYLTSPSTNLGSGAVAHFDATGVLVSNWGSNGVAAPIPYATLLRIQADHKVIATGVFVSSVVPSEQTIANFRLDAGAPDPDYGIQGEFDFPIQNEPALSPISSEFDAADNLLIASYGYNFPFAIARSTDAGAADAGFNGSGQQPGFPGFAALNLDGNNYSGSEGIWQAHALADGHILAIGDVGFDPSSVALIRLNADASYDSSFGDIAHPGWSSISIGGTASSNTYTRALAADASGHVYVTINVTSDANGHYCSGLVRLIPDRLLDGSFDEPPAMPTCPQ